MFDTQSARSKMKKKMIDATEYYLKAKAELYAQGFASEIMWQESVSPCKTTEHVFLREAAWVIYCSGFKESILRQKFNYLSLCFFDWLSAEKIAANAENCVSTAMLGFANKSKHQAILAIAQRIASHGFDVFWKNIRTDVLKNMMQLPYIGPITAIHLAKNLGFDMAKPDRHLVRVTQHLGFDCAQGMCESISSNTGDSIRVIDLVLWRYAERGTKFLADGF